jgi:hypothetical protein
MQFKHPNDDDLLISTVFFNQLVAKYQNNPYRKFMSHTNIHELMAYI